MREMRCARKRTDDEILFPFKMKNNFIWFDLDICYEYEAQKNERSEGERCVHDENESTMMSFHSSHFVIVDAKFPLFIETLF